MRTSRQLFPALTPTLVFTTSLALAEVPSGSSPAQPAKATPQGAAAAQPAAARPAAPAPRPPAAAPQGAKRRGREARAAQPVDRPVATFPGFRMLPNGGSRVFLQVSGKADVVESKAEGRLVYRLKGVQVIQTNRFPLVTSFFATPVSKVQLVGQRGDLDLVIDLRSRTEPTYTVVETEAGTVLQVDFPRVEREPRAAESASSGRPPVVRGVGKSMGAPEPGDEDEGAPEDF